MSRMILMALALAACSAEQARVIELLCDQETADTEERYEFTDCLEQGIAGSATWEHWDTAESLGATGTTESLGATGTAGFDTECNTDDAETDARTCSIDKTSTGTSWTCEQTTTSEEPTENTSTVDDELPDTSTCTETNESTITYCDTHIDTETETTAEIDLCESVEHHDGLWCDPATGLVWETEIVGTPDVWIGKYNYCIGLELAVYTDWRMPSESELKTLLVSVEGCLWNEEVFGTEGCNWSGYWANPQDPLYMPPPTAPRISFETGDTTWLGISNYIGAVRCVRGWRQ